MADVQAIGKDSRNQQQNFNFRGIDAVMNAVGPAFRAHGVVCVPIEAGYDAEHYETSKKTQMRGITVRIKWRFYGPDGSYIDAESLGEAADAGDKAISKAHSVAYRTVLLQALCIPTGDEDPDSQSHQRAVIRQEGPPGFPVPSSWPKVEAAVRACDNPDEAWALWEAFLRAATYHLYGKTSLKEITTEERKVMFQKAAGAVVWLQTNVQHEGPFRFFDEDKQRAAWASILGGTVLAIPDYVPIEPEGEVDPEAERLAREALAGEGYE